MLNLNCPPLLAAIVVSAILIGADARSAELEGALQYPPLSIGEDAQPPPPARMLPTRVSPSRIELGVSESSLPSKTQKAFVRPQDRLGGSEAVPPTESGGN
jgi:hypothetical protein